MMHAILMCILCVLQTAFHERIAFCLNLHNEAVKAMRFEPDAHKRALAAANGRKEPTPEEIARECGVLFWLVLLLCFACMHAASVVLGFYHP
jgi:hypothetical protein